jgi:protein TonB
MSIPDLLKAASQAVDEQHLVTPPGSNAIEYYLAVTEREPNNMQATQALVDIFPMVATVAEREIAQRRVDEADRIVALLDRASPGSYTVTTIRTKLDAARALLQREQDQQLAAQQARQQAADAAAAEAAAAATPPAAPASASPAATASRPATPTPAPAPPSTPAASTEPVATAAAPPSGGETRGARPLRQVQPEYPIEAARKRQEGWVELEFTIGTDGRVSEVTVLRAQPARVFNREATRAMQQWTFEPALESGEAVVSRERRRIEFQL